MDFLQEVGAWRRHVTADRAFYVVEGSISVCQIAANLVERCLERQDLVTDGPTVLNRQESFGNTLLPVGERLRILYIALLITLQQFIAPLVYARSVGW